MTTAVAWLLVHNHILVSEASVATTRVLGRNQFAYAGLLLLQLALSIGLADAIFRLYGGRLLGELNAEPISAWVKIFRSERPDSGHDAMAEALLNDESIVRGIVQYYTPDHELGDRELVLAEPIQHELNGLSIFGSRPAPARLILPSSSIRSIAVRYIPTDSAN